MKLKHIKNFFELIRIKHWIKNFLIFIPFVCAKIVTVSNLYKTILAFFAFSFTSSVIYIINDIRDVEQDKLHPKKKKRPLASGLVKKKTAIIIAIVFGILSIAINYFINKSFLNNSLYILLSYFIINLLYSFGLKNISILDILLLATSYILRIYYGAFIVEIPVSNWLFLTVFSASMFLGFGKRKKELVYNKNVRKVLEQYSESFLDKFQYLMLNSFLIFYSLWAIEQDDKYMVFSVPLIIIVVIRYCLIIEKSEEGDPTTIIYQDKILFVLCLIYAIAMVLLLSI